MKISPLLSIAIVSLLLASCTWSPKTREDTRAPGEIPTVVSDDSTPTPEETTTPDGTKKETQPAATPDTNTATQPTAENPEVSTEDLTKELDAFVDDITKGL